MPAARVHIDHDRPLLRQHTHSPSQGGDKKHRGEERPFIKHTLDSAPIDLIDPSMCCAAPDPSQAWKVKED